MRARARRARALLRDRRRAHRYPSPLDAHPYAIGALAYGIHTGQDPFTVLSELTVPDLFPPPVPFPMDGYSLRLIAQYAEGKA